mmetsp:Transcript_26889/g.47845  ORF Transcript_26889/g.47845 Transcript_26889/m.47845 type:complete len:433 (+) Transcript_26889:184-1482(+)
MYSTSPLLAQMWLSTLRTWKSQPVQWKFGTIPLLADPLSGTAASPPAKALVIKSAKSSVPSLPPSAAGATRAGTKAWAGFAGAPHGSAVTAASCLGTFSGFNGGSGAASILAVCSGSPFSSAGGGSLLGSDFLREALSFEDDFFDSLSASLLGGARGAPLPMSNSSTPTFSCLGSALGSVLGSFFPGFSSSESQPDGSATAAAGPSGMAAASFLGLEAEDFSFAGSSSLSQPEDCASTGGAESTGAAFSSSLSQPEGAASLAEQAAGPSGTGLAADAFSLAAAMLAAGFAFSSSLSQPEGSSPAFSALAWLWEDAGGRGAADIAIAGGGSGAAAEAGVGTFITSAGVRPAAFSPSFAQGDSARGESWPSEALSSALTAPSFGRRLAWSAGSSFKGFTGGRSSFFSGSSGSSSWAFSSAFCSFAFFFSAFSFL